MFKENAKIAYGMDRIMDRLRTMRRGEVLTHDEISSLSGIRRDSAQYATIRQKIRKHALKHLRFTIVAVQGVGYKIATAGDQANDAMQRANRSSRQLHRGIREVSAAPEDSLTDHQRRVKHSKIQVFKAGRQLTRRAAKINEVLSKVPESLPRRGSQEAV